MEIKEWFWEKGLWKISSDTFGVYLPKKRSKNFKKQVELVETMGRNFSVNATWKFYS